MPDEPVVDRAGGQRGGDRRAVGSSGTITEQRMVVPSSTAAARRAGEGFPRRDTLAQIELARRVVQVVDAPQSDEATRFFGLTGMQARIQKR
jgi:hypothetical protein